MTNKKETKSLEDTPHLEEPSKKSKRIDVHSTKSDLLGFAGIVESSIRTFKSLAFVLSMAPITLMCLIAMGLSIFPGFLFVRFCFNFSSDYGLILQALVTSISIGLGYFLYGMTLIFVIPLFNKMFFLNLRPWRGNWYSLKSIPWYYHNALVQIVRYTFLDLVTPTPINILFYKMMGMKVGKGVMINTTNISDPCLITLEDNVTIGGSATLFGHYAQGGYLVLAPVVIKKGATVGLKASIMGDVVVGEKVTVKPHSILLPKTRLNKGDPQ